MASFSDGLITVETVVSKYSNVVFIVDNALSYIQLILGSRSQACHAN